MSTAKRITIKDIARAAGLSSASVSQALRPKENSSIKLTEDTIERVKKVAKRMNYRPHAGARSIRAQSFNNLGFFNAKEGLFTHSPDGYVAGIHDAADEKGYRVTLIRMPLQAESIQHKLPSIFDEQNLDALIIGSYHSITARIHERLRQDNLPVVYLNEKHAENSVYVDDEKGSKTITQYLLEKGNKSIGYVQRKTPQNPSIEQMHHSAADRLQGYTDAMRQAGLEASVSTILSSNVVGPGSELQDDWWDSVKHHDALLTYDDDLANSIARFLYKKNIRIPDGISLAGYNGDYGSLSAWNNLTTMRIPSYKMGKAAVDMAAELVRTKNNQPIPSIKFEPELVKGDTA